MSSIKTITLATIYENQGLKDDALQIYEYILSANPNNEEARLGVERLKGQEGKKYESKANAQWLEVFANIADSNQNKKFQQWLLQWN
ncbi:hypothetical protein CQA49_05380 [Helicobacter sp. MIT 00-7814]|uniref:hypothetical protein n=1 Tax=unclassified Helicobacter TaxID=2593540 RepID=UPI000E1E4734|nr:MULTISPECIES: hypothetical protein [unclassified Helicobacter]RDU54220.1 hypothetical protein CQA49_05380 [Helicobacter sp. MIT 00-7814]RDU56034.1 hypothetical protein CQA37_03040 [Helicobacter sp. MIT 99-10781]